MKNTALLLVILLSFLSISACSTFKRTIASEEDRKAELYSVTNKVLKAYRWSSFEDLAPLFSGKISIDSVQELRRFYKGKKVKEAELEQVDFENEAHRAYQLLSVKTFSAPRYMIESHLDQITWEFSATQGGWTILKIDVGNTSSSENLELP